MIRVLTREEVKRLRLFAAERFGVNPFTAKLEVREFSCRNEGVIDANMLLFANVPDAWDNWPINKIDIEFTHNGLAHIDIEVHNGSFFHGVFGALLHSEKGIQEFTVGGAPVE